MRVLIANLRQFYECRRLWGIYFFWCLPLYFALRLVQLGRDASSVLVIVGLPAGWIVATMQEDVAAKPFSFCLRNHRDNVRKLVFLVGLIPSMAGALYFALNCRLSDASLEAWVLVACLGLCFTWSTYLIGIALTLVIGSGVAMSVAIMTPVVVMGTFHLDWRPDYAILSHPLLVILLGVSMSGIVWQWLGRPGWFRKNCGKPAAEILSASVRSSEQEERQMAASVELPEFPSGLDRCLLGIIRTAEYPASIKGLAGAMYATLTPLFLLLLKWKTGIPWMLPLLLIVLVAGYTPDLGFMFILIPLLMAANGLNEGSPLFSEMLFQGGRRERFYVSTIFVVILAILSAGILLLPILMLNLLAPWLPDVGIHGLTLSFHPVSPGLPMLSMIVFPVLGLSGFWLHARRRGAVIVFGIMLMVQMPVLLWHRHISEIPLPILVLTGILAWLAFVLGVHWIAMRSDLVRR